MLPIRDINPVQRTPLVNYLLIAANIAAFVWMRTLPAWYEPGYALVPSRVAIDPPGEAFTILTSMFMHGGIAHLLGNLWFLWIFGDNVEDALGHGRYLGFYLASGLAAAIAQVAFDLGSPIPMVGASGAIAGVTAAYVVLYPRAPVLVMNPFPPLWLLFGVTFMVPAWIIVGEFFLMNLFGGLETLGRQAQGSAPGGGVAVFAHLGGFVAGILLILPIRSGTRRQRRRTWDGWRPPEGRRWG